MVEVKSLKYLSASVALKLFGFSKKKLLEELPLPRLDETLDEIEIEYAEVKSLKYLSASVALKLFGCSKKKLLEELPLPRLGETLDKIEYDRMVEHNVKLMEKGEQRREKRKIQKKKRSSGKRFWIIN